MLHGISILRATYEDIPEKGIILRSKEPVFQYGKGRGVVFRPSNHLSHSEEFV
jgi:hypothetical protein